MSNFAPTVVESAAALAETVRMPLARNAEYVYEVLDETDSVLITFNTEWWGGEAFDVWGDTFFVHVDGTSEKALFVREGIPASDPVNKLRSEASIYASKGGLTSKAARKYRRKALNWDNTRKIPGPGMPPTEDRDYFEDASCPLSVIEHAIRTPEDDDNLLFVPSTGTTEGRLSQSDVVVTGIERTRFGPKFTLGGDTYDVLSSQGADVSSDVAWDEAHLAWDDDADAWTCDKTAIDTVIDAITAAGYTVGVDADVRSTVESICGVDDMADAADESDSAETFGEAGFGVDG